MSRKGKLTLKDLSTEFVVGVFFFLALLILGYFTIILSKEAFFEDRWDIKVEFPDVAGLNEGDHVTVRGVRIGTIRDISLENASVLVSASLTKKLEIREGYAITVRTSSILGGRHMAIEDGPRDAPLVSGDKPLRGEPPADIMADTADLVRDIKDQVDEVSKVFKETDVFSKIAVMVNDLQTITSQITEGKGTIGRLVNDEEMYHNMIEALEQLRDGAGNFNEVALNVNEAIADARDGKGLLGKMLTDEELYEDTRMLIANLREGKGTIGKLLTDEQVYNDLEALIANLRKTSDEIEKGDSTIGMLVADGGKLYEQLLKAIENTEQVSAQIRKGEGTVGKLVMDESLYDDVRATIKQIRNAIEDLREQAPISTFGSFVFGAL